MLEFFNVLKLKALAKVSAFARQSFNKIGLYIYNSSLINLKIQIYNSVQLFGADNYKVAGAQIITLLLNIKVYVSRHKIVYFIAVMSVKRVRVERGSADYTFFTVTNNRIFKGMVDFVYHNFTSLTDLTQYRLSKLQ